MYRSSWSRAQSRLLSGGMTRTFSISFEQMSLSLRAAALAMLIVTAAVAAACSGRLLGKQYEYEEDLHLSLDGSATLIVNASIPALVALRGLPLDPTPSSRLDIGKVRAAYESAVTDVTRVGRWHRRGRRFVQIRLKVKDVRRLSESPPFSWSRYELGAQNGRHVFEQRVTASALRAGTLQNVGWDGSETVAFRIHLPSRILWHNSRDLTTDEPLGPARGNILGWEQHLADRLEGRALHIRVEMDSRSILYRTLWLFGGAFLAAILALAGLIWFTMKKGEREAATSHSLLVSASVLRAFVTESSPRPVASDRASMRSTGLLTTPASVTCPLSTMM
jgi:hypothetical protein